MDNTYSTRLLERLKRTGVVIMGGSAGAFTPMFSIIKALPADYDKAVIIIIHRGKNNFSDLENLFGENCRMKVKEISDKDEIAAGQVYIAPSNYHTLTEKGGTFALDVSEPVWYSKPSIDVTFESAADAFGSWCTAILFSGANQDGASGLLKLRQSGALTITQTPADAEMSSMPQAAVDIDAAEYVLTAGQIINVLRDSFE